MQMQRGGLMGFYHKVTCDKCGRAYELKEKDYGRLADGWQDFERMIKYDIQYFVFCPDHANEYRNILKLVDDYEKKTFNDWMGEDDS